MEPARDARPSNYVQGMSCLQILLRSGHHKGGKGGLLDIPKACISLEVAVGKFQSKNRCCSCFRFLDPLRGTFHGAEVRRCVHCWQVTSRMQASRQDSQSDHRGKKYLGNMDEGLGRREKSTQGSLKEWKGCETYFPSLASLLNISLPLVRMHLISPPAIFQSGYR